MDEKGEKILAVPEHKLALLDKRLRGGDLSASNEKILFTNSNSNSSFPIYGLSPSFSNSNSSLNNSPEKKDILVSRLLNFIFLFCYKGKV